MNIEQGITISDFRSNRILILGVAGELAFYINHKSKFVNPCS
jgi:hypothetical protein